MTTRLEIISSGVLHQPIYQWEYVRATVDMDDLSFVLFQNPKSLCNFGYVAVVIVSCGNLIVYDLFWVKILPLIRILMDLREKSHA